MRSPTAQRELISQAHDDLMILEDDRHARTLYINQRGVVSCLEWEMRRTEFHFTPKGNWMFIAFAALASAFFTHVALNVQTAESAEPEISKTVTLMAAKLEVDNPDDLTRLREEQITRMLDDLNRQRDLEKRILATFKDAPTDIVDRRVPVPLPTNPTPTRRSEKHGEPTFGASVGVTRKPPSMFGRDIEGVTM